MSGETALGCVECSSIARGAAAAEEMAKKVDVRLLEVRPFCPGRHLIIMEGAVGPVREAVRRGVETGAEFLVDSCIIADLHPDLAAALGGGVPPRYDDGAWGVVESATVSSCLVATDLMLKRADVGIVDLRLGRCLAGKAFCVVNGDIGAVTSAVEEGERILASRGALVNSVVIPSPHHELARMWG